MTSKEWAEKVQVSDLYGSMWADVIADLAAAEERADGMERAGAEQARRADDNAAKLEDAEETILGLREKDRDRDISYTIMGEREEKALKAYEDAAQELHETQGKLANARLDAGRLRDALDKYGDHLGTCRTLHPEHHPLCDCGYDVTLAALAAPAEGLWEKLKPYLRHKEGCEALGVHTDDCTCGLEALLGGEK